MHQPIILITGCSSGIGRHCALSLSKKGYRVFAQVRKAEHGKELAKSGIEVVQFDYADIASIEDAFTSIMSRTDNKLDALFNNGAYGQPGAVEDLPTEVLAQQFQVNLFGWHHLTRLVIPVMRKHGYGRIVQCSSILGLLPMKYRGAYNASKYALEGLSLTLRMELRGSGISLSLIEPGPIHSDFQKNALAAFHRNIDAKNSFFSQVYIDRANVMEQGSSSVFKLKPNAVEKALLKILTSKNPKPRYFVTAPTYALSFVQRLLPQSAFIRLMGFISDRE